MNKGPTLNPRYNALLISWARQGCTEPPVCEECDKSLVDHDVIDGDVGWYCSEECLEEAEVGFVDVDDREDFHSDI